MSRDVIRCLATNDALRIEHNDISVKRKFSWKKVVREEEWRERIE
jgi:hypothetical protein